MWDLLRNRRSVRKFQNREVEDEKIDTILKGALTAPTSKNRRQCEFIVVKEKEKLEKLSQCREHGSQFLAGAPLAVIVAVDGEPYDIWIEDASIAAIIIQLAAHSLGLKTRWVQVRNRQHDENTSTEAYLKETLEIPESVKVECVIAIGYGAEEKKAYDEESLLYNKIHFEKY